MNSSDLKSKITEYANTREGEFLARFDWQSVKIKVLPFGIEGIIQACYCVLIKTIRIAQNTNDPDAVIFGDAVHELYHAYQHAQAGTAKYLLYKAVRRSKLEAPAERAGLAAVQWYIDNVIMR